MAPQQTVDFNEWDDDEMIVPSARIINSGPQSQDCDCELGQSSSSVEPESTIMTPRSPTKELPPSILRRRLCPTQQQQQEGHSLSSLPSHWPKRQRVHFADGPRRPISSSPPSVITAIYYRPRTPVADVPSLYYSALDVKNFKREFRALLKSQKLARQRLQQNSEERLSSTTDVSHAACPQGRTTTTVQHRDNSFWRSKVSRWSAQTKPTSATVSDDLSSGGNGESTNQCVTDYDDEVHSPSGPGGIFSSVFDVAREAASLFGTSGSSTYYHKDRAPQQNQNHLIDTLYLF